MTDRPNILLITTDQQRFDTIRVAGYEFMKTPNLDRLADEAVCMRTPILRILRVYLQDIIF